VLVVGKYVFTFSERGTRSSPLRGERATRKGRDTFERPPESGYCPYYREKDTRRSCTGAGEKKRDEERRRGSLCLIEATTKEKKRLSHWRRSESVRLGSD